jgi:hypothetical protein
MSHYHSRYVSVFHRGGRLRVEHRYQHLTAVQLQRARTVTVMDSMMVRDSGETEGKNGELTREIYKAMEITR